MSADADSQKRERFAQGQFEQQGRGSAEVTVDKHKPIVCHRCGKRIADRGEHSAAKLRKNNPDVLLAVRTREWWAFIDSVCGCPERHNSVFTSRPQPANLENIERKMK